MFNYSKYITKDNPLSICPKYLLEEHFGKQANDYLPCDTGIEIECNVPENWNRNWLDLPGIIENRSDMHELRLRIPGGLKGFKLIWDICEHLNSKNYILTESAIHYHVDISGHVDQIKEISTDDFIKNFVKNEILRWDHVNAITNGSGYVFFKKNNTIEIRCGKMTFNYQEMLKDILWSHYIIKYVKEYAVKKEYIQYNELVKNRKETELKAADLIKHRFIPLEL